MTILDDLRAAIEQTKPIVYYAINDALTPGKTIRIASDGFYPDLWLFHPDDFEAWRAELARQCRLVDFHTWEPTKDATDREFARIIKSIRTGE